MQKYSTSVRKKYNYQGKVVGVEYDNEIIRLYHQHFKSKYTLTPTLYTSDAEAFISVADNSTYDIIFIDLFIELDNSPLLHKQQFLESLEKKCTSSSTLVFNITTVNQSGI